MEITENKTFYEDNFKKEFPEVVKIVNEMFKDIKDNNNIMNDNTSLQIWSDDREHWHITDKSGVMHNHYGFLVTSKTELEDVLEDACDITKVDKIIKFGDIKKLMFYSSNYCLKGARTGRVLFQSWRHKKTDEYDDKLVSLIQSDIRCLNPNYGSYQCVISIHLSGL